MENDFYNKYLKYKLKYFKLKEQVGGDLPILENMRDINLFVKGSQMDQYLNPIYGYLSVKTGFIQNYYLFKHTNRIDEYIGSVVHNLFKYIGSIQPTNELRSIRLRDIGKYLILLYLDKFYDVTSIKTNLIKEVDKLSGLKTKIKTQIKTIKHTPEISKIIKEIKQNNPKIEESLEIYKQKFDEEIKKESTENQVKIVDLLGKINQLEKEIDCLENKIKKLDQYKFALSFDQFTSKNFKLIKQKINSENNDNKLFKVMLAILWWNCNDQTGLFEYYIGINEILAVINNFLPDKIDLINIPYNYSELRYNSKQLNKDKTFEITLINIDKNQNEINLFNQEWSKDFCIPGKKYADCGETVVRNFINILIFDEETKKFNTKILEKYCGIPELINYYQIFEFMTDQTSNNVRTIFGGEYTSRDAWSKLIKNLPNVRYLRKCENDGTNYEIAAGKNIFDYKLNLLQVISSLLPKIQKWENIEEMKITTKINDETNLGKIFLEIRGIVYTIYLMEGHYHIKQIDNKKLNLNLEILNPSEKEYVKILTKTIEPGSVNDRNFIDVFWDIEFTIETINNYPINKNISRENYNRLFNLAYEHFDDDQKRRIFLSLNFIDDINNYDLRKFGNEPNYNDSVDSNNIINITFIKIIDLDDVEILENLKHIEILNETELKKLERDNHTIQKITFSDTFNNHLGNFLDSFVNLEILDFGKNFDQPLNKSLNNLSNLKGIRFGELFNKGIGWSLQNLVNLEALIFGKEFNQDVNLFLIPLKKINYIEFGIKFTSTLKPNVFKGLDNIEQLVFKGPIDLEDLAIAIKPLKKLKSITINKKLHTNLILNEKLRQSIDNIKNPDGGYIQRSLIIKNFKNKN